MYYYHKSKLEVYRSTTGSSFVKRDSAAFAHAAATRGPTAAAKKAT